ALTLAGGHTSTITFAFSEAVPAFAANRVTEPGGTLSNLQQVTGDPTHYTATFMPATNFQGSGSVQVLASGSGAASWTDAAGNAGTASNMFSITENIQTVTINSGATVELSAASAAAITFANNSGMSGTLLLDNPITFTGQIFGFTGTGPNQSDMVDLKGIAFDGGTSWVYSDNTGSDTGGILTIFETVSGTTSAVYSITFGNG